MRRSFLIRIELPGHEEEVITNSMEQDGDIKHPQAAKRIAIRQQQIAQRPGKQSGDQNVLHGKTAKDERHKEHHYNFGGLAKGHFSGSIIYVQFIDRKSTRL